MSQFEQHLKAAQRRQRRIYLGAILGITASIVVIVSILLVTRATRIEILPQEAKDIARLEVSAGLAFITGNSLYALSGNPAVKVQADGFYTRQQQLTDMDFGNVMTITLKPLPAKLHLRSPMNDNRTKWLLNDELYVQSDELVRELEPGDYTVSVLHPFYKIKNIYLSLGKGESVEQTVSLEKVQGMLKLNTQPQDALLIVDQVEQGKSPTSLLLSGGQYEVKVVKEGFEPIAETIEITREASQLERDYRLESEKGQVIVKLNPPGGKLLLNKLEVAAADTFRLDVNQTHNMVYSKPGYFSQSKTFRVSTDNITEVGFNLEKETGKVELDSSPKAEVSVNGETVGTTPLTLILDALPQEITFSKTGYRTVVKKVIPDSKSVKVINANLVPEKVATMQEAPSTYKHKAGGTMKLYRPGETFSMGAERSEPGQRANEFVRQVSLTRPFYAGVNEVSHAVYSKFDNSKQGQAALPVTNISWLDAVRFCNWLSEQEGLATVYRIQGNIVRGANPAADGYRLLTEAEWEWLARKANRPARTRF
ncbi:MAG: PEGA domain-containing protein, partial [Gammaproteobacteria bacterium]